MYLCDKTEGIVGVRLHKKSIEGEISLHVGYYLYSCRSKAVKLGWYSWLYIYISLGIPNEECLLVQRQLQVVHCPCSAHLRRLFQY